MKKIAIFCDFDGTVALEDVGELLFSTFTPEGESKKIADMWARGEITSRECLEREAELIDVKRGELDRFVIQRRLDPFFKDFHDFAKKRNMEVFITSDGLDYYIETLLLRNGLGDIEFFANHLVVDEDRFEVEFPHFDLMDCTDCGCCKTHHIHRYREEGYFIIYVGDGLSDRCPIEAADMVFAKDDLLDFCRENRIEHIEFRNFRDVEREVLERIVLDEGFHSAAGE